MRKLFTIFVLALTISCDEEKPRFCMAITFAEALPIQIWQNDEESFNEEEECMIEKYCFNQEFECNDNIRLQAIQTEYGQSLSMIGTDDEGNEVIDELFDDEDIFSTDTELQFDNTEFTSSLINWDQFSASPGTDKGWVWDASGSALADGTVGTLSQTFEIYQSRPDLGLGGYPKWPPGTYTFQIRLDNQSSGGSSPLQEGLTINAFDTPGVFGEQVITNITRGGGMSIYDIEFTTTQGWEFLSFLLYKQGPSSGSTIKIYVDYFRITGYPLDYSYTVFRLAFVPNDHDLCDKLVAFKLYDGDSNEVGRTDAVRFSNQIACNTLVKYRAQVNFAGIVYDEYSEFNEIRIPGVFYHRAPVTTQASIELSNNTVLTRAYTKKKRTRWQIQDMPYYMHDKLEAILSHSVKGQVQINGVLWSLATGDDYKQGEDRPDSYPMRDAEVLLTRKNYFKQSAL